MQSPSKVLSVWKQVFSQKKYVFLMLIIAVVFYLVNGLIYNIGNIVPLFSSNFSLAVNFLLVSSFEYIYLIVPFTAVAIIILSLQMGMLISLLTFRFKRARDSTLGKTGVVSGIGVFLGAAAPGCAACGVGLLSFLGLSSIIVTLPFKGQEIVVLAILLMSFSIYTISGKIYNTTCQVNFNPNAEKLKGGKKQIGREKK